MVALMLNNHVKVKLHKVKVIKALGIDKSEIMWVESEWMSEFKFEKELSGSYFAKCK